MRVSHPFPYVCCFLSGVCAERLWAEWMGRGNYNAILMSIVLAGMFLWIDWALFHTRLLR